MLNISSPAHEAAIGQAEQFIARRQFQAAEGLVLQVLGQNPSHLRAIQLLGDIAAAVWQMDRAAEIYRRGMAIYPKNADLHNALGIALRGQGRMHAAAEAFRGALALEPRHFAARVNLVGALRDQANASAAVEAARENVAMFPESAAAHSELLATLHYVPGVSPGEMFEEHRAFGRKFEPAGRVERIETDRTVGRVLRIGYVSPDFCTHPVASFFEPVIAAHDRAKFHVTCYSDTPRPDAVTQRLAGHAGAFKATAGLSDDQLFEVIRADGIDILVDLAGHTFRNRLGVFALRAAPIQVTWLGYPNTTGLRAMDYRMTSVAADPVGAEEFHTERLVRLPETFLSYQVEANLPPIRVREASRPITLGSFNMMAKLNRPLVGMWAEILRALPTARLLLKAHGLAEPAAQVQIAEWFGERGVEAARLEFRGYTPTRAAHLEMYNEIDLALDTHPYNGTTTTCEALAMGVPVLTLAGETHHSRVGSMLLAAVGLEKLVTRTAEEYVRTTIAWCAGDQAEDGKEAIARRLRASVLTDGVRFAGEVEVTYRRMWEEFCAHGPG